MSSTDPAADVGRFFDEVIVPLGDHVHAENGPLFPRRPDASAETYYTTTTRRTFAPRDVELPNLTDPEEVRIALERMWSASGRSELVPLAATFGAWVVALRQEGPESAEVSALVYVMY
jgi:hypothetical protein